MGPSSHSPRFPKRGFRRWEKAGIRTLKSGEVFDAAFTLYRRDGLQLLRLIAVPAAATFGMLALSWHLIGPSLFTTEHPESVLMQAWELIIMLGIGLFAAAPFIFLAYSYMSGAVALFVSDRHLGRWPNAAVIHRLTLRKLPRLVLANLAILLAVCAGWIVGGGLLLLSALISARTGDADPYAPVISVLGVLGLMGGTLVLPFAFSAYCLAPLVLLLERVSVRRALSRSRELMGGLSDPARMTAIGLAVVTLLLQLLLWGSLQLPAGMLEQGAFTADIASGTLLFKVAYQMVSLLGAFVSFILVHPVLISGLTLLYYDRRVRAEGYDIELLSQEIWKRDRSVDFEL
ncbi:MAG: hypothetical protein IH851_07895 [Armatimonadetes bacterium]|nr:hypothetical protein [Armatimonadota bacterium]